MKSYKKWEAEFPDRYKCRDVLDSNCPGEWVWAGKPTDFRCDTCGRLLDTKAGGGWKVENGALSGFVSQIPYDEHYTADTILAVRTSDGTEYAFYKGDCRVLFSGEPSDKGTKEYGDTSWHRIQTQSAQKLFSVQMLLGL